MDISKKQLAEFTYWLADMEEMGCADWLLRHTDIEFDDVCHTITITIDNMNEQDYKEIKDNENPNNP